LGDGAEQTSRGRTRIVQQRRVMVRAWLGIAMLAMSASAGVDLAAQSVAASATATTTDVVTRVTRDARVGTVAAAGFTVADMDRSLAFFTDVLDFEIVWDREVSGEMYERLLGVFPARMRVVRLRLGTEEVELTEYITPRGRPVPVDMKSNDLSFQHIAIVVSDMDQAYAKLRAVRIPHVSSAPQRLPEWNRNAAGIEAFYFRDPDDHVLEIIHFPEGKGDPRWQQSGGRTFLGIDHTAIAVSDTEASLRFYRDVLGFHEAGASENYGTEQEHLNAVFGARLRITAMRVEGGPGIEFLEYLTPRDGRPMPLDEKASDLFHWQTTLVTNDLDAVARRLRDTHYRFVSPGVVSIDGTLGFRRGVLVRDPDRHVMQVVER
jgi:catechol 2,3-dioxygenase-like lactoylglutathione lyase family enzyme